jgi:hypothetical protein
MVRKLPIQAYMASNTDRGCEKDKKVRLLFQRLREQINQAENEVLKILNNTDPDVDGTDSSGKYKKRKVASFETDTSFDHNFMITASTSLNSLNESNVANDSTSTVLPKKRRFLNSRRGSSGSSSDTTKRNRCLLKTKPKKAVVTSNTDANRINVNNGYNNSIGTLAINKMVIYNPMPEDPATRSYRVGRILGINRHTASITVHHYDCYQQNKKKMSGVRFRPAYSNDNPDRPLEVYAFKVTAKLISRYGKFTKMYNDIPQNQCILYFDCLTKSCQVPRNIIDKYKILKFPKAKKEHINNI